MSALSRCARYARVFHRSLHSYNSNVVIHLPKLQTNVLGSHIKSFCLRPGISKRLYATAENTIEQDVLKDSRRELQESRKKFKHSAEYPACLFWKKYDYSKTRKLNDFETACKNIYFAIVSQKGISAAEFHDFMSIVEQRDDFTDDEIKLILKTVGFLNKEVRGEDKVRWTEYLTNRFISLGIPLDVTYYNQVLRNYLQMNHPFSSVEIMSTMEKQGVAPNGVTLSRFVVAYCKVGDIKSASQVLEHMRSREMSINARVYNNLILGNFIAGDKDTAMQLFRDATDMGFTMDASVYHAAIVGHALTGDLDGVKQLVQEANDNMIVFSDGAYSTMIEQVAPKGRQDIIDYILDLLKKSSTFYYNECFDTLPGLMEQGNHDLAYKYFRGLSDPSARLFYKAALLSNMEPEDVVKYCRQMKVDGIRDSTLLEYFGLAVVKYLYEPAVAILPHFTAEGEILRPHMMWPLIQYYKIMEDLEGLKKILPYLSFTDGGKTVSYMESALNSFKLTKEEYLAVLKNHTVLNEGQINACMIHNLLSDGWEVAAEYASTCKSVEDMSDDGMHLLGGILMKGLKKTNWQHALEILAAISNRSPGVENYVIRNILQMNTDLQDVKIIMLDKGIKVGENTLSEEFKALFSEEELSTVIRKRLTFEQMKAMSLQELLAAKSYSVNSITYKACVLDKSYKAKKWELYQSTLQSVDLMNQLSMPTIGFQAARFYIQHLADVTSCMKIMLQLQSKFPGYIPYASGMLAVASRVCEAGRHEDAVKLLSGYSYSDEGSGEPLFVDTKPFFSMEPVQENIRLADKLLETLSNNGYLRRNRNILVHYWNFISSCGDLNTILDAFEMLKLQHNFNPNDFGIAFGHFIRQGDKPSLQTAYDKFTDVVMEQSVLLSLAAAFVENGQIENARKTLHTPGMRLLTNNFKWICQRWASNGKPELIEEFTNLVENMPGQLNKAETRLINLKAMCNRPNPDVDAVVRYFDTKFDEEDLEVNVDACRVYANFLRNHNHPVPFDKFTLDFIDSNKQQLKHSEKTQNSEPAEKKQTNDMQPLAVKDTEKINAQQETSKGKKAKHNMVDNAKRFTTLLSQADFLSALQVCKKLSTDEIKQLLPDDLPLLTKWAEFLMNHYHTRELDCIPAESLRQILNEQLAGKGGDKLTWTCQKWRFLLEKEPDTLLSHLPEMNIVDQTQCFVASLYTYDIKKVKAVKKAVGSPEKSKFVHEVIKRFNNRQVHTDFKVDSSKKRELYFTLIDSLDGEEIKAFAMSYALKAFMIANDMNSVELLSEKATSSGLTFGTVAELLPSVKAREIFMANIHKVEEDFQLQGKSVTWEPSCNWTIKTGLAEGHAELTDISTEKAVTDLSTEIGDETKVAVVEESPISLTVAVADKTEVLSVENDAEEIADSAKIVSSESEIEMKDKAKVITNHSSELDSKIEVEKE